MKTQNPFTFGNPVMDRSLFVGRANEINFIVNRLRSTAHESTSLVGESRMGNTSLLKYLSGSNASDEFGLKPDQYCLVYIDFQGQTDITPYLFWKRVIRSIYRVTNHPKVKELAKQYLELDNYDLFDLEDFFFEIREIGIITALLMDEFEYVTQSPNISGDFYGLLRSLAIHSNLCLVVGTRHFLSDLCHQEEIKGSPFFNIFATVQLENFSPKDTDQMLDLYLEKSDLAYTSEEKQFIATLGGGHPYFLQMAGYYWFEARENGLEEQQLFDEVRKNCCQQSIPHFKALWSASSSQEKDLLIEIARSEMDGFSTQPDLEDANKLSALKNLKRRGLISKKDEKWGPNLPCMRSFINQLDDLYKYSKGSPEMHPDQKLKASKYDTYLVFISHSAQDKHYADSVVEGLEARGIPCWIAPRDISPGTPYPEAIINALNICRFLVIIFSKAANDSVQVMQEVERAVSKKLIIIPLRFEDLTPSGSFELMLSSRQWLDAFSAQPGAYLDVLVKTIKG